MTGPAPFGALLATLRATLRCSLQTPETLQDLPEPMKPSHVQVVLKARHAGCKWEGVKSDMIQDLSW